MVLHGCVLILAVFCSITLFAETGYSNNDQSQAALCRERSQRLRAAVQRCNERIAQRQIVSCAVTLPYRGGVEISMQEANSLALLFDQRAAGFDGIERQINDVKMKIQRTQDAIRALGFDKRQGEFEEWERLSAEAKKDFQKTAWNALFDTSITGVRTGAKAMGSIGTAQGNKIVSHLKQKGIDVPELNNAIQSLARAKGKPEKAKLADAALDRLQKTKDATLIAYDGLLKVQTLTTALGWLVNDPKLSVLISEFDFTISALYNNITRRVSAYQIEKLTELTQRQMGELKTLSARMKGHVEEIQPLRQKMNSMPVCR